MFKLIFKLSADIPAAAINQGTRPEQKVLCSTLKTLAKDLSKENFCGATLLVIGKVAGLAHKLNWFTQFTMPQHLSETDLDST